VHYQHENNGCWQVKPGVCISLIAMESTEGNKNVIKTGIVSSRVFRGFRGHKFHHYQIETVLEILACFTIINQRLSGKN
jgi:hypothetical protein